MGAALRRRTKPPNKMSNFGAGSLCPASAWESWLRRGRWPVFVSPFSFGAQRDMCCNDGSNVNDRETWAAAAEAARVDMEMWQQEGAHVYDSTEWLWRWVTWPPPTGNIIDIYWHDVGIWVIWRSGFVWLQGHLPRHIRCWRRIDHYLCEREKVIAELRDNDQLHSKKESRTTTHLGKIHYYHCSKNRAAIFMPLSGTQFFEDVL